ncbi:MAG: tRNA threonylcarbamoyladenosine dehydratase [Clostridia bacterium]|nr:tRNA threonylcarbamoyladenosine dehydratase [Clostridia bacterium]
MEKSDDRLRILIGEEGIERLHASKVTVCGIGGVGGYAAEAVARSFVGRIVLVDGDVVQPSNLNRQIVATEATIGQKKADAMKARLSLVNSLAEVTAESVFITPENVGGLPIWDSDVIIDAIDDVTAKVALIREAKTRGVKIVSAMGAANRVDPMAFKVADISETHTCPLAKKMRRELAACGITDGVTVVFSTEKPASFGGALGSNAFVPAAAGLTVASAAFSKLLEANEK